MKQIAFKAMGSRMAIFIDRDSLAARQILDAAPGWFEEWEQILSRFRPDSYLSILNARAGRPVRVHPVLFKVVRQAIASARLTDGLVTPTLLRPLEKAGYAQSFEMINVGRLPKSAIDGAPGDTDEILAPIDWRSIELDESNGTITIPPGMGLDLGGIGKGWAADQAMLRLEEAGPVLVDASGDLAISGPRLDGSPWPVGITDPHHIQDRLDLLALSQRCGVATSGIDYHRWMADGAWKHHIIDPRTAQPVETDLLSVTVIAPDSVQAEAAAKAVLIQGSAAGLEWLENQPGCSGLLALQDGRLLYSDQFEGVIWS